MRFQDRRDQTQPPASPSGVEFAQTRRQLLSGAAAIGVSTAFSGPVSAQTPAPVRIAIAFGDIPRLWAGPDGAFQGMRFAGYPIYDALINWDLDQEDRASGLVPGLAESWSIDPNNPARWIVKLRSGVTFHDGSPFDADAAIWNFNSVFDQKAQQYNAARTALIVPRLPSVSGAEKVDDSTIAVLTRGPDAMTPYQISFLLMASPAQYAKLGDSWEKFVSAPSGTGPFRFGSFTPRVRLELVRNEKYWDTKRIPKAPAVHLQPILDANARIAALRSGQVDLIETVPPAALASLKGAGFSIKANTHPTISIWKLSLLPDSPFRDLRVRKAANLAVDREGIIKLLDGAAVLAKGMVPEDSPWFGKPTFQLRTDPAEARKLLAEAGYGPNNRVKAKILIASAGGGQPESLKVNEFVQSNLAAVGFDIEFQVVDYVTLFTIYRNGAKAAQSAGIHGVSLPAPVQDPTASIFRGHASELTPPRGTNWGFYNNPEVDEALRQAQRAFGPVALDAAIAKVHQLLIDDAASVFFVHELDPWGMSNKVKGFMQPKNWFSNLTSVSIG